MTKEELIKYTIDETAKISLLPMSVLCERGNYFQPEARYPQKPSEKYVNSLLDLYLAQEWLEPESEPLLDEISSVLGELDKDTDNERAWRHLFRLVNGL